MVETRYPTLDMGNLSAIIREASPQKTKRRIRAGGLHARRFLEGLCRLVGYHARKVFDKAILCPNAYSWLIRHWFRFLMKDSAALIGVNSMKGSSLAAKKIPT